MKIQRRFTEAGRDPYDVMGRVLAMEKGRRSANFFLANGRDHLFHRYDLAKPRFRKVMLDCLAPLMKQSRLGPVLVQLPPNFTRDDDRLKTFLEQVPPTVRWAIEFRHESWHTTEIEELLRHYHVSWVAAETDESPAQIRDTAEFWYVRLRRSEYTEAALLEWAARFTDMARQGKECFIYCKHEDEGSPWIWADRLLKLVGR